VPVPGLYVGAHLLAHILQHFIHVHATTATITIAPNTLPATITPTGRVDLGAATNVGFALLELRD